MIDYILCFIVLPFGIAILYNGFKFHKDWMLVGASATFFINAISNLGYYAWFGRLLSSKTFFSLSFYVGYCVFSIVLLWIGFYIVTKLKAKPHYYYQKLTWSSGTIAIVACLYFGWLLQNSGRLSFDQFLYNLRTPVNMGTDSFMQEMLPLAILTLVLLISFWIMLRKQTLFQPIKRKQMLDSPFMYRSIPIGLLIFCLCLPIYSFHLEDAYAYFFEKNEFVKDNYVSPNDVTITFPEKKQNLVFIFVESLESSFFSSELGGIDEHNLLANLTTFMDEGDNFSASDKFGGAISMPGTHWTIAGMATTLGGINYNLPLDVKDEDQQARVLPGLITLGDILKSEGYYQEFMIGAISNNYNLGPFFRQHGDANIQDLGTRKADHSLPDDYLEWWGFEDKKLYAYAQETLADLATSQEPFALFLSSNDTHGPNGYTDASCPRDYTQPYRNAVACSDQLLSDFLTWLKQQSYYEDTTVVIVGDHISHEVEYFKEFDKDVQRNIFNLILNSKTPEEHYQSKQRQFFAADLFPTIVSSLGATIEGNQLGLGVNLYADETTLIERYGADYVTTQLTSNSQFYNETFVYQDNSYSK